MIPADHDEAPELQRDEVRIEVGLIRERRGEGETRRPPHVRTAYQRWQQLVSNLPDPPPRAAGPILERARMLHERTRIELIRLRDSLLGDVATASTAKRTAAGYGAAATAPRLDRTA